MEEKIRMEGKGIYGTFDVMGRIFEVVL